MLTSEASVLARYPVLPEASQAVGERVPDVETFLKGEEFAGAREQGLRRMVRALKGEPLRPREGDPERELLAYAYARILASGLNEKYAVRRLALAEALRLAENLSDESNADVVVRVAAAAGFDVVATPDGYAAHYASYLKAATHLKDTEWKLVRQAVVRGMVPLSREKVARLAQELWRRRIEVELPKPDLVEFVLPLMSEHLEVLRAITREHAEKYVGFTTGEANLEWMPPCMKHLLGELQRGANVAHTGRFAISAFLKGIGMRPDDIMRLFAQAPDFREDLTRYQVEHITGVSSGTEYTAPGCQAMKTFGHCVGADELCHSRWKDGSLRVTHPFKYYRAREWRAGRTRVPAEQQKSDA